MAAGGDAIARDPSGRVVFVTGALPGERVRVEVVAERRDYARAVAVSPDASTVASCGNDTLIKLWKTDGTPISTLDGTPGGRHEIMLRLPNGTFHRPEEVVPDTANIEF